MAAPFVPATNQTAMHGQLVQAQEQLRAALNALKKQRDIMAQMISGGNDYTLLESQFGYTAGQGTFVFAQTDNLYAVFQTNASQSAVMDKTSQWLNQVG